MISKQRNLRRLASAERKALAQWACLTPGTQEYKAAGRRWRKASSALRKFAIERLKP